MLFWLFVQYTSCIDDDDDDDWYLAATFVHKVG